MANSQDANGNRGLHAPDISEHGGIRDGERQTSTRRLYMQLLAYGGCTDSAAIREALAGWGSPAVLYADVNDPTGVALLTFSEDPSYFVQTLRPALQSPPFDSLVPKPAFTMLGRTYSLGYEPDLEDALVHRPVRYVLNKAWPWAIWYPLRRSGAYTQLPVEERRAMLREHGSIGRAFGEADYAHDVRLACHGLDRNDNDFVVGLVGKDLHPLSAMVEAMRETRQTAQFLERLGPFLIGRVLWQSEP